jgi:hypothetical protein
MYINFKLLNSRQLSPSDFMFLCAAKANKNEDNSGVIEYHFKDNLERFKDSNLITFTKPKNKSENVYSTVRLSSLGNEWMDDLTTVDVDENTLKMRDYLCQIYLNNEDTERVIGNKKLIASHIATLRSHIGLSLYEFFYLCEYFLSVHIYTKKLENIFMDRNKNRYGDFKNNINDSVLYQFWEQHEEEIRQYFKQKIKP